MTTILRVGDGVPERVTKSLEDRGYKMILAMGAGRPGAKIEGISSGGL